MLAKIRVLTEETINQIAAGEVVENPASIVKELVENSIDAGARRVVVTIKGGGHLLVRVADDGFGMTPDDALLSLERHATSKISKIKDLDVLSSMGFRGEALATISAISKVKIETKMGDHPATEVICHGGRLLSNKEIARNQGTTIEVLAPFYNTPARRKFQKSATQSTSEISRIITKLALAHNDVGFELISQDKRLMKTSTDPDLRIEEVLGNEYRRDIRKVDFSENGHRVTGVVGTPQQKRHNRSGQYFFVNERPISSSILSNGVKDAFATRIGKGEFPICVLYLSLPSDLVDVNVHPQKETVRFQNEGMIRHYISKAVQDALLEFEEVVPTVSFAPDFTPAKTSFSLSEPISNYTYQASAQQSLPKETDSGKTFWAKQLDEQIIEVLGFQDRFAVVQVQGESNLFQSDNGFVLVDLHQASSRITFDTLVKRMEKETHTPCQALLFPETLDLTPVESEVVLKHIDILKQIGFDLRPLDGGSFALEGVAQNFSLDSAKKVIHELIAEMRVRVDISEIAKIAVATRGKKSYTKSEASSLIRQLGECTDKQYGPTGKRIFISMDKEFLTDVFAKGIHV